MIKILLNAVLLVQAILGGLLVTMLVVATGAPPIPENKPRKRTTVKAAAVVPMPVAVIVSWDYPPSELSNDLTFRVYHATNIVDVPVQWTLVTNVVGSTVATIPVIPDQHYFSVRTYSAFWNIETPMSDAASTPPAPRSGANLNIKRTP